MPVLNENAPIVRIMESVKDFRMDRCKAYPLSEILFLALVATICNANSFPTIVRFGLLNIDWLRTYFEYAAGIPSHDTINRCMALISKKEMENILSEMVKQIKPNVVDKQICIDGKSLSGSATKTQQQISKENGGKHASHLLGAFFHEFGLIIGQMDIANKGSEGNCIPAFLDTLWIKGAVISLDAGGCYTEVVDAIIERDAHYFIACKDNQPTLNQAITHAFANIDVEEDGLHDTYNEGHGRRELRSCKVLDAECLGLELTSKWKNIKTIVEIEYIAIKKTDDLMTGDFHRHGIRHFISDQILTAVQGLGLGRNHWGIENTKHFVLDTVLLEDKARIREGNAPANMALIRRVALNYVKAFQISLPKKHSLVELRYDACTSATQRDRILSTIL
jgi:predicted transposase YbfD/YdcC